MPAVSKTNAKALAEKRADIIQKAQLFITEHEDEQGLLSAEDQAAVDAQLAEAQTLADQIKTRKSMERAIESVGDTDPADFSPNRRAGDNGANEDGKILVRQGFGRDGKPQYKAIKPTQRGTAAYHDAFVGGMINQGLKRPLTEGQYAALQSDDAAAAGYLLASEQFVAEILKAVDDEVLIRQYANITTVPNADSLGIRKRTAKMATWAWGTELQVATADSTLAYGKKVLTPHPATGQATISRDFLRRSAGLAESEIRYEMARDGGELMENAYLTGTGNQRPLGVFVATSDGISTARDQQTGSTTSITADGLKSAKYKLKQQYRRAGGSRSGARWMFHRDGIAILSKLKDGNGNYLLSPGRGLVDDQTDMLLGFPVDESEFAPNTFTTGLYVGILACWQYYRIADALDMEVQTLVELDARTNQVSYIGRLKTDGMPVLEEAFVRLITN